MQLTLKNLDDTKKIARAMAKASTPPLVIFLEGDLGAGKTTLVRAFLRARGFDGLVKSPTYTLIESYDLDDCTVIHADFYRLSHANEVAELALDESITHSITLIEWPQLAQQFGIQADLHLTLNLESEEKRNLNLKAQSFKGQEIKNEVLQSI